MNPIKKYWPAALVAAVAYLLYANWKLEETQPLAHAAACGNGGCIDPQPAKSDRNPFTHKYQWQGTGMIDVTCRRGMVLLGRWECKVKRKQAAAAEARDDMDQYPTQTKRSVE